MTSSLRNVNDEASSKEGWVHFGEDETESAKNSPAVLDTQSEQVTIETSRGNLSPISKKGISSSNSEPVNGAVSISSTVKREISSIDVSPLSPASLHNVPLSEPPLPRNESSTQREVIRQGFANGDVIVTILPQNTSLPWIWPARFRPELVPEELMAQGLTLTVEDYVHVMSQLVNDHRFNLYNICYKRILMAWISLAFIILLCILFLKLPQYGLFGAGIAWLMVNAGAIFVCMWIKLRLNKNLERCLANINSQLMKHNILLGVDDRGKLSCHKINLCFIYFDPQECIKKLQQSIEQHRDREGDKPGPSVDQRYDIEDPEIIITGATNTKVSRQQKKAESVLMQYSQRWVKHLVRGGLSLDGTDRIAGGLQEPPLCARHMSCKQCLCQFIEEHLKYKSEEYCKFCLRMAEFNPIFSLG